MNLRNILHLRRIPPLFSLLTVLTGLACGTIALDYSADLRSPDDVTIVMDLSLTDGFVEMASDTDSQFSPNNPSLADWKTEILVDEIDKYKARLSKTFKGQDAADILNPESVNEDGENSIRLIMHEVDKGKYIEYRIEFSPESFATSSDDTDSSDDLDELGIAEGMEAALAGMLRVDITLKVFGDIIETNAHQTVENEFTWQYNFITFNEVSENHSLIPYVITRVNKNSGIFGSCRGSDDASTTNVPLVNPTPYPTYTPFPTWTPIPKPTSTPIVIYEESTPIPVPKPTSTPIMIYEESTPIPDPSQPRGLGTYESPLYLKGNSATITVSSKKKYQIFIGEQVRGQKALDLLVEQSISEYGQDLVDRPEAGIEYIIFDIGLLNEGNDLLNFSSYDANVFTNGEMLELPFTFSYKPELDLSLLPGASGNGVVTRLVYANDSNPLLWWDALYATDITEGVWISLEKFKAQTDL